MMLRLSFKVVLIFPLAAKGEAAEFCIVFAPFLFSEILVVVIDGQRDSKEKNIYIKISARVKCCGRPLITEP